MQTVTLKGFHLSFQQERLWHWSQGNQIYHSQCAVQLEGALDFVQFRRALQHVVDTYEILHTTFYTAPGMELPMQVINKNVLPFCLYVNIEHLPQDRQQRALEAQWQELQQHSFDLEHGPLLRALLLRTAAQVHVLVLSLPAICADATTLQRLIPLFLDTYDACVHGQPHLTNEDELQYLDVSSWQNDLLQEEDVEQQQEIWRKMKLSRQYDSPLPFRSNRINSQQGEHECKSLAEPLEQVEIELSAALQSQFLELSQHYQVSSETCLLACWQILLWRLTQETPSIGLVCDGRPYEELSMILGPNAWMVPFALNTPFSHDVNFEWVLQQTQQVLSEVVEKQLYFNWEALSPERERTQQVFPLSFAFSSWPQQWGVGSLVAHLLQQQSGSEPPQVQLHATQIGSQLRLSVLYQPGIFSQAEARRLARLMHTLLGSILAAPQAHLGTLDLLTESEQVLQQARWSGVEQSWPFLPLHRQVQAQAARQPAAPALRCGEVLLSYEQLEQRANQLAHLLLAQGLQPGQRVALYQHRDHWAIISLLAVLKAGGCYVPLDEDLPAARVQLVIEQLAPFVLICSQTLASRLPQEQSYPLLLVEDLPDLLATQPGSVPQVNVRPQQEAVLIYTSGSTGVPKGVQISQQGISNYTQALCDLLAVQVGWHFATVSSLAADLGNTSIFCALASGGCLHLLPYALVTDGAALSAYVKQYPLDVLKIVPTHLQALLAAGTEGILPRQRLILGGEALPWSLLEHLQECEDVPKNCLLYNHYGPTETTIGCLVNPLGPIHQIAIPVSGERGQSVPIGRPIANVRVAIWDEQQQQVPAGIKGELYIAGAGVALGYLGQPELTAQRFVSRKDGRWYRSGDIVRENEEGLIEFIGRRDSQVKLRGYRIELGEIEAQLRSLPQTREAVVLLRTDVPGRQQEPCLVGYVVPWKQSGAEPQTIREALAQILPSYLVPSRIICLEQLPLSANGKVDRRRLPVPTGEQEERNQGEAQEQARTPIEGLMQQIWRQVLQTERIGREDDFFQVGGHSLLGTRMIAQLRSAFGVEVPITWLFETPRLADLSARIEEALRQGHGLLQPPLMPAAREEGQYLPLSFAQQRLWFLDQLEPGSTAYSIPRLLRLHGDLNRAALQQALETVILRHENLRTTFPSEQEEPRLRISPQSLTPLYVLDLSQLAPAACEAQARQLAQQEVSGPFDLAQGPLLRCWLLHLRQDEHLLLLTLHHIISDGWSTGLLAQEVTTLYTAFQSGEAARLPALPIQYADYALWQRSWLQGEVLEQQLDYWRSQLAGLAPLDLPTDHRRAAGQGMRGAIQRVQLSETLSQQLQQLSQQGGVTLFMMLLAAFQMLLARYSGQGDIAVGTPIANRTHKETEGLIGFFVNMLVLRSDLSDNPSFRELLGRVRATALGAYAHQDVPFEQVVEAVPAARPSQRSPLFQVLFALQNTPEAETEQTAVQVEEGISELDTAKFELSLIVVEREQGLQAAIEYMVDLFDDATIARWLSQWEQLLKAIVADPDQHLLSLPLLPVDEPAPTPLDWHLLAPAQVAHYEQALAAFLQTPGLLVLDDANQPVPAGVVGQLYLTGLRAPEAAEQAVEVQEERLIQDPWSQEPGARLYRTGQRVRYRASGVLEDLDQVQHPRQFIHKGIELSLDALEAVVLAQTTVQQCRILARTSQSGAEELVGYVVTSAQGSTEIWQEQVLAALPQQGLVLRYVQVSHLPLTPTGAVDDQALLALAPISAQSLGKWEQYLRHQPGVEQVAVVLQESATPATAQLPLHLSDLLPEWKRHALQHFQEEPANTPVQREDLPDVQNVRWSISEGGSLPVQEVKTLPQALLRAARQHPEARLICILPDGSELIWTYQQLLTEAQRVLAGLRHLGVRPQERVIMQVEACHEFLPLLWGCLLGGIVPVPASIAPTYEQPTSASSRLYQAWKMLDRPIVVAGDSLGLSLQALADSQGWDNFRVVSFSSLQAINNPGTVTYYDSQPEDLALMLLTSGSTGIPKGVMQQHASLLSMISSMVQSQRFSQNEVTFNWMPLDHVGGVVMFHLRDVYLGCSQIHAPTQLILQDPLKWLDWIDKYRVTITWAPNFAFGLVNDQVQDSKRRRWDLSSLHFILNGGEAIVARVARRFLELLQPHGLSAEAMHPAWGMSETSSGIVFSNRFSLASTSDEDPFVEVGAPIPGISIRIVDAQDQLVSEGVIGHLQVKGATITAGYYQNPQVNKEVFHSDGWFDTGDLGFLRDGRLSITGRAKDVIIINGVNYYSQEIEATVDELEEVETSYTAACAVRDEESTTDQLAVFVVSRLSEQQIPEVLRKVRAKVSARVGITPTYVLPVSQDDIPKTGIGKIQRTQLKQAFESGQYHELLKELDRRMGNANTLPNWFYRKCWRPAQMAERLSAQTQGVVLVLGDGSELGRALCERLREREQRCIYIEQGASFKRLAVDHYQIDPALEADYNWLGAALTVEQIMVNYVAHLWGYHSGRTEDPQGEHLKAAHHRVLSLVYLVQALERGWSKQERLEGDQVKLAVVSAQVEAIQGDEALAYEQAPVVGLLKTLGQELPWLQCMHLDVPAQEQAYTVSQVLQELDYNRQEPEVAYRAGHRFVARLQHIDWSAEATQPLPLIQQGVYLLSGGLGGLGYDLARHLLQEYQARLLLIGRTTIDQEATSIIATARTQTLAARLRHLQELAREGGAVQYVAVDVCDPHGVQQAVQQAQEVWQRPLDGIFHLAGTFHEQVIQRETARSVEQILSPKIEGTWNLHHLLKDRPGTLFVSFSSINAFFGGRGVGAYAAANSFLESFARYQRERCQLKSYCVSWSMWDEVGMSQGYQFKAFSQVRGYQSITVQQGWYALLALLHHAPDTVLVGLDGTNQHIRPLLVGPVAALQEAVAYVAPGWSSASAQSGWPTWWGSLPSNYRLEIRSSLPLKESGEIDVERLGGLSQSSEQARGREPRTEQEQQILEIWREVLKNPHLGVLDNFFEAGGHSLLATQAVARLQQTFQIEVSVRSLFEHPTVTDLAHMFERQQQQSYMAPSLLPVSREQPLPLSFAQQRLWFLEQLQPGNVAYSIPATVAFEGAFSLEAFTRSLQLLEARHESLRTTFEQGQDHPYQVIAPAGQVRMRLIDLQALAPEKRESVARQFIEQEALLPFDLRTGPLWRVWVMRLGEQRQWVRLSMHHIISDGWSMQVLVRDLAHFYHSCQAGVPANLTPLPIQYVDYACWQRQWLQGDMLKEHLRYWTQQLSGARAIEISTDYPRPLMPAQSGARYQFRLDAELTQALNEMSRREGATLFMTALTAFQVLLYRLTGQEDIVVGTDSANRGRVETEGLIGFFINLLALRTTMHDNPRFMSVLREARDMILGAYAHQDLPFEMIAEHLRLERKGNRTPLVNVLFVMQNVPQAEVEFSDLTLRMVAQEATHAKFDMAFFVTEDTEGLFGSVTYSTDLFKQDTIATLVQRYEALLRSIVARPDAKVASLEIATEDEKMQKAGQQAELRRNLKMSRGKRQHLSGEGGMLPAQES